MFIRVGQWAFNTRHIADVEFTNNYIKITMSYHPFDPEALIPNEFDFLVGTPEYKALLEYFSNPENVRILC